MRKVVIPAFLAVCALCIIISNPSYKASAAGERAEYHPKNHSPVLAAQILYTPAKNTRQLAREIKAMKAQGINTIIFRVFGNRGDRVYPLASSSVPHPFSFPFSPPLSSSPADGVYYSTDHAPVIGNLLATVAEIVHSYNMELFAWMTTRDAVYGLDDSYFDGEYDLSAQRVKTIAKLDLFNPKSVRHLESLYSELARQPIDGVLFQDDFILRHMEGVSTAARVRYLDEFKRLLEPSRMFTEVHLRQNGRVAKIVYTDEFWRWAHWKNERLIQVSKRLINAVKRENPRIKTCFNATYELYTKPRNALAWQSHSVELADEFDLIAVMAYQRQIARELGINLDGAKEVVREATQRAVARHGARRVIMKIQAAEWGDKSPIPKSEIRSFYRAIKSVSSNVGVAFVPWEQDVRLPRNLGSSHPIPALDNKRHRAPIY